MRISQEFDPRNPQRQETHHTSHTTPQSLFILSGELRNTIYRLLLTSPIVSNLRRLASNNHLCSSILPSFAIPLSLNILLVSRRTYNEASPIFYTENTFSAHPSLLTSLPCLINPQRPMRAPGLGKRICRWYVNVRLDCDARYDAEALCAAFDGVEELEIEAHEAMFRAAGPDVLLMYAAIRGVKKARVVGSVDATFARWLEGCVMSAPGDNVPNYEAWVAEEKGLDAAHPWQLNSKAYDPWTHSSR